GTSLLFDREVARSQPDKKHIVSIGKITPKGFRHPIHAFSIYDPKIQNWLRKPSEEELAGFIIKKNRALEYFFGNAEKYIRPNFSVAEKELLQAGEEYYKITGRHDLATQRILEYISENPFPPPYFFVEGMRIEGKQGDQKIFGLSPLARRLLEASDTELYQALVIDTTWEKFFNLEWVEPGRPLIRIGDYPDGVYSIVHGAVDILDGDGNLISTLQDGEIFGEMAFFSSDGRRTASAVAASDLAVRKISNEDFQKLPQVIQKALKNLAQKRLKGK
ncbi:MAG: cyclic nucleotide-binding domain-containing protein, partial [Deltaproteobacteria bacterium]|nr:cyclic nucleotide-binding domain-containing protein [Deltaproteobacteria bacterium]